MSIKNKITKTILFLVYSIVLTIVISPFRAASADSGAHIASAINSARGKLSIIGEKTGFGKATTLGDVGLYDKIASIINIALGFIGIIAVIFIIYAGFKWLTAGGNEDQVKSSRDIIRNAVIGIGIVMLAYVITNFVTKSLIGVIQERQGTGDSENPIGACSWVSLDCNPTNIMCEMITQDECNDKNDCPTAGINPQWHPNLRICPDDI